MVYVGLGGQVESSTLGNQLIWTLNDEFLPHDNKVILLSSHLSPNPNSPIAIRKIPLTDTESQNYITACDLVVSKAGYSTISEAIRGKVPMLLIKRDGISEDDPLVDEVEFLGVAKRIQLLRNSKGTLASLFTNGLKNRNFQRAYNHLPSRYRRNGNSEVASHILKLLS